MERFQGEVTDGDFDPPVWIFVSSATRKTRLFTDPEIHCRGGQLLANSKRVG